MHNNNDKETCESHHHISRRLCEKQDVKRQSKTGDKFNELIDHFAQLHKHEHPNEMETERMNLMANTCKIQPPRHTSIEHSDTIRQKGNKIKGK